MALKVKSSAPLCAALLLYTHVVRADQPQYNATTMFKNYAISVCIAGGYKSEEVIEDASAGARGYLEFGSFPLDAYTEANALSEQFLAKPYEGMSGERLVLMKCIDFYHSRELDRIARKYAKKKK